MKHRHAIFRSRLGLALCFMLAGGAIIPQSSVLKAENLRYATIPENNGYDHRH